MTSLDGYGRGAIVTPEAVLLDFEIAGLASRSLAYAIDFTVQFLALLAFAFVIGFAAAGSELVGLIILLVGLIVIVLGYSVIMETFNNGRTLGRMVIKSRVVTVEGAPIRFRQALIRSLLGIVDLLISVGLIAVVTSLVTTRGQRLGDLVAGTMVIRDAPGRDRGQAVTFWPPAYLAEWTRTVDVRSLDDNTYQLARDVLTRPDLIDAQRERVMYDVASLVSTLLPHAARPAALPARDYLLGIVSAAQGPSSAPSPPPPVRRAVDLPPPPGYGGTNPTQGPTPTVPASLPPPPGYGLPGPTPPQTPRPAATPAIGTEPPTWPTAPPGASAPASTPAPGPASSAVEPPPPGTAPPNTAPPNTAPPDTTPPDTTPTPPNEPDSHGFAPPG